MRLGSGRRLAAFALLLGSLFWAPPARAVRPLPTRLLDLSLSPYALGEPIRVTVQLTTLEGEPLPGQEIALHLADRPPQSAQTDPSGVARFIFPGMSSAGIYPLRAVYAGPYQAVTLEKDLVVEAAELQVQTIPALEGVPFSVDGQTMHTDRDGVIRYRVHEAGMVQIELLPYGEGRQEGRVTFARWEPESFERTLAVHVPTVTRVQAGFEVRLPIEMTFADQRGRAVDSGRISAITVRSSLGERLELEPGEPRILPANVLRRRLSGLDSVTVVYSIQSVLIDGSNVVNRGQQRLALSTPGAKQIELLLFTASFSGKDPLFGFPIGTGVILEYPDGRTRHHPFDETGSVTIQGLARGAYLARLAGAPGISIPVPVVVSRDQAVGLPAISYLDLAAVGLGALLFIIGIPLAGRPGLRKAVIKSLAVE